MLAPHTSPGVSCNELQNYVHHICVSYALSQSADAADEHRVFDTLMKPVQRIENSDIHHITNEMVADAPHHPEAFCLWAEWLLNRCKAVGGCRPVIAGHNIKS